MIDHGGDRQVQQLFAAKADQDCEHGRPLVHQMAYTASGKFGKATVSVGTEIVDL